MIIYVFNRINFITWLLSEFKHKKKRRERERERERTNSDHRLLQFHAIITSIGRRMTKKLLPFDCFLGNNVMYGTPTKQEKKGTSKYQNILILRKFGAAAAAAASILNFDLSCWHVEWNGLTYFIICWKK